MASSASLKELSKAINTFIVQPSLPLPDSLVATIEAYIDKHEKYDDVVADKLQDELIAIFEKHVLGKPEATGPWMGILRRLQWGVQSPQKVLYWFDAAQRILDSTPLEKKVVSETIKAMMNTIAVADKYQDSQVGEPGPNPIIDRLLAIWIEKFYPGVMEDNKAGEHNEKMLREALELFGKKRTKEFFASLDKRFMQKKHRKASLRFLTGFIQCQPPHLYQVAETKFFGHLLTCLQRDTSTTVVSAALTSLIMLMPHMPSSLTPKLPTLFNIYSRLLFWGPERTGTIEVVKSDGDESADWQIAAFDAATEDVDITHLEPYYTILYGLYPINFTDYIRKPQRYLRHANTSSTDDVEVQPTEIRHRSERFRQTHLLHPNFYTLTIDSEKTDFSRWIKCEAAEVVADCVSLRIGSAADAGPEELPGSPVDGNQSEICDAAHRDSPEPGLLNSSVNKVHSWRHAQFSSADSVSSDRPGSGALVRRGSHSSQPSTRDATEAKPRSGADSPAPSAHLGRSPSQAHLHDLTKPSKPIKSSLYQSVANASVASLALSNQESLADKPSTQTSMPPPAMPQSAGSVPPVGDLHTQLAHLQRRISILENDLTFERYLKQQHIAHIGDMRSRHMTEAATEAETQNLILMTRSLRVQYENAKKAEMQVRKEAEKSRSMAKKWEVDLSNKLKNLREETKKSTTEHEVVGNELVAAKLECEKLRKLLGKAEVKELTWKQNVQSVEIQREEVDRLRVEVGRLVQSERDHQVKEREMDSTIAASKDAETQSTEVNMKLKAKEDEVQRTKTMLQSQVRSLREQISELQEERVRPGASPSLEVENALASSRAKQAELKKEYDLLLRKYKALQSGVLDMESRTAEAARHPRQSDIEPIATPTSPLVARGRLQRVDSLDAPRMSVMPSSEPQTPSLSRKTTNSLGGEAAEAGSSSRPDQRYFSGFASRIRKDSVADKQKDDGTAAKPKKEKKTTLRGIRGFV